jgi:dimethylglycine catabolism A
MTSSSALPLAAGSASYPRSFSTLALGELVLRNRVFVSAHTTNFGLNFLPTERHVDYHRERARGGAGLIICEPLRVHPTSLGRPGGLFATAAALPGLQRITSAVRAEGAAVFTQITHAGRHSENVFRRTAAWGPSDRRYSVTGPVPHVMSRRDMAEIRDSYVRAATLAVAAGFQGIEVHFGHGHLLHQYISPIANDRTDEYGGSFAGRMRYPMEVLDAVLDEVGDAVPVGVRVSADELVAGGGQSLDEGCEIAALLSQQPVAFVNVSIASYTVPSIGHHVADMSEGHAPYLAQTLAVARAAGSTPVLAACRFVDLADVERALETDLIDAVAMTRAHIADPHLVRKAAEGREDEIRPCVACNFCIGEIGAHRPMTCMMNPAVGRESEWPVDIPRAEHPRSVVVIGGGPAGLEAARVAAERGHQVDLWEREAELGGQLRVGRRGAGRGELDRLRLYEERQLGRLGVRVHTNAEVSASDLRRIEPEVVLVATGCSTPAHSLEGWDRPLAVADALDGREWTGRRAVIVDDEGAWRTASVAETLARSGAVVHVVTSAERALWGINDYSRMTALERLRGLGVQIWTSSSVAFGDRALVTSSLTSMTYEIADLTDVVVIGNERAEDALLEGDSSIETHVIGDACAPRSLLDAMHEAHSIARGL